MVLEKHVEDQLDRSGGKKDVTSCQGAEEYPTLNKETEGQLDWSLFVWKLPSTAGY
jgi:hypothetical protein